MTADQLVVTAQPPGDVASGASFGLAVAAEDAAGNVDTSFAGSVTVSLIDLGGSNATLVWILTTQASDGWPNSPAWS